MSGTATLHTRAAFKAFYLENAEAVRNFLYYKSGNLQLAEDLMQEAFVRVWNKRSDLDAEKARGYVFSVARNLFLDHVRHQQVVLKFEKTPQEDRSYQDPQYEMEMEEFREQLAKAISSLTEASREVFLMNRIDKLSYKEIAQRLDISVKAVEKRMSKALAELRKLHKKI